MGLSHTTLENYYSTIFAMAQHHKYSISDIENLIVFERDIYIEMLIQHLRTQKEMLEKR